MNPSLEWTTDDEIRFLNGLGKGVHVPKGRGYWRLVMLNGTYQWAPEEKMRELMLRSYIESAKKRVRWGKISKDVVIAHAQGLLKRIAQLDGPNESH